MISVVEAESPSFTSSDFSGQTPPPHHHNTTWTASLNCSRDVLEDLPGLLVVAHLFVTLPLQVPRYKDLKVEPVEHQVAAQERVGLPLVNKHWGGGQKKKKKRCWARQLHRCGCTPAWTRTHCLDTLPSALFDSSSAVSNLRTQTECPPGGRSSRSTRGRRTSAWNNMVTRAPARGSQVGHTEAHGKLPKPSRRL